MRSRTPVIAALAIAVLAVIVALWSALGGGDSAESPPRAAMALRPAGGTFLKDRPLPAVPPAIEERGQPPVDENLPPPAAGGETSGGPDTPAERAERTRRQMAEARAEARRLAASAPRAEEGSGEPVVEQPGAIGAAAPEEPPPPTFDPGSLYDGLSQDDLLELILAMCRLRDAGVFQKLTPEQYVAVAQLLPDLQGVQDADEITQRILGMGVGEWLDHERGPKGRFILR